MKVPSSDFPTVVGRYHRTLQQAFPFGPEYGCALHGPYRRPLSFRPGPVVAWVIAFLCVMWVAA